MGFTALKLKQSILFNMTMQLSKTLHNLTLFFL